ncbi:MAG: flavin reductase family protein [Candidatus Margulisiibacteriota bacterium]
MNQEFLRKLGYGMYVVASKKGELINGQIANAVIQVTAQPATIAISINRGNLTHDYISSSKIFSVSTLEKETPLRFIGQFGFKSGRDGDKFAGIKYKAGAGCPVVLEHAVSYLEAKVVSSLDVGTHTIFIGEVQAGEILLDGVETMTYAYYHDVKRGTSPASAPTYLQQEDKR